MEAPTPVSAYLHSATMVKAGVYLLARVSPILGGTGAWLSIVTAVGAATMLTGGVLALYQTDLKRMLAYSTISALGMLVLLLGLGSAGAIVAAVVFLLAHALYKGALFMVAGALDHETGTRDIERLGGLRRAMPITAAVAGLAAVSLAGFGPVLSFIGKELALEAVLDGQCLSALLTSAVTTSGALFVAVAAIVGIRPFFGDPDQRRSAPTRRCQACGWGRRCWPARGWRSDCCRRSSSRLSAQRWVRSWAGPRTCISRSGTASISRWASASYRCSPAWACTAPGTCCVARRAGWRARLAGGRRAGTAWH
jgi:NADH:ubiquinone oxidoreductase subunit 5 (subunit L)/multisubunit Na+/H+ antiporter MnhA subunit